MTTVSTHTLQVPGATITGRTSAAIAEALAQPLTIFPSHHSGFLGGEDGQAGEPEAFAATLHEVLDTAIA